MAKKMKRMTLLSVLITAIFVVWYGNTEYDALLTLAITFGTTSYHLGMRLLAGTLIHILLNNHVDYRKRWFRVSAAEEKLYQKMKVKKWKNKMGTYDPSCFDPKIHSWDEIAQAMCQAELVHELIILLSFLPVFAAIPFGALPVFLITSLLASCFDAMFVVMQRYNRPRIVKLIEKTCSGKYYGIRKI